MNEDPLSCAASAPGDQTSPELENDRQFVFTGTGNTYLTPGKARASRWRQKRALEAAESSRLAGRR
jgi:hypothetical protein